MKCTAVRFGILGYKSNASDRRRRQLILEQNTEPMSPAAQVMIAKAVRAEQRRQRALTRRNNAALVRATKREAAQERAHKKQTYPQILQGVAMAMTLAVAIGGNNPKDRMLAALGSFYLGMVGYTVKKDYFNEPVDERCRKKSQRLA